MNRDELPEGWESLGLGKVITVAYGKALKAEHRRHGGFSVFGSGGLVGTHDTALNLNETIVIGRKGSVGSVFHSVAPCWPIDTTYFVADFGGILPRYLFRWLQAADLADLDTSSAIPGLNRDDLYSLIVPVPPLSEQRRIVAAVERVLGKVSAARARLERVPTTLKRFRQAVLAAACSGRLTAGWRSSPKDELVESLPPTWKLKPLAEISTRVTDGTHLPPPLSTSGIPFVLIGNVVNGKIDWTAIRKWVSQETFEKLTSKCRPERGDVLYTAVGATFGQALTVETDRAFIFQRHIAHIKPLKSQVDPDYLALNLNSPEQYEHAKDVARGAAQPTVTLTDLKQFEIPLPPLAEQREIVRRVSALFVRTDAIEARATAALKRVESLAQAVLAKAFRGELVPTEAELARRENRPFESAAELLARVRSASVVADHDRPPRSRKPK